MFSGQKINRRKKISKNRIMIFPLIFILGGLFLIFNDMGIIRWYQLRNERNQIKVQIDQLLQNKKTLTVELDHLKNDKEYIKKIAQEKFHMVSPGEKVFRVIDRRKTN